MVLAFNEEPRTLVHIQACSVRVNQSSDHLSVPLFTVHVMGYIHNNNCKTQHHGSMRSKLVPNALLMSGEGRSELNIGMIVILQCHVNLIWRCSLAPLHNSDVKVMSLCYPHAIIESSI